MFFRNVSTQIPHHSMLEDGHSGCIYFESLRVIQVLYFCYTFKIPFVVENRAIPNSDERVVPYALP